MMMAKGYQDNGERIPGLYQGDTRMMKRGCQDDGQEIPG